MDWSISYADPAVGGVFTALSIPDDDLAAIDHDARQHPEGFPQRLRTYVWGRFPALMCHEWAHILQVAEYPLLHLRAARQQRLIGQWLSALAHEPVPRPLPIESQVVDDWQWSRLIETVPIRLVIEDDKISMIPIAPGTIVRGALRELDLVEEDASIFQYRIEIGSRGTGAGYRRWLLERTRYCALFHFLTDFMSDDDALNLVPVLTRAAFWTVRPVEALAAMLTDLVRDGADTYTRPFPDEDWDDWAEDFFRHRLLERFGAADMTATDFRVPDGLVKQGVVSSAAFDTMLDRAPILPASLFARWSREEDGLIGHTLRAPWQFFERGGAAWDKRLDRFAPPVMIYRLTGEETEAQRAYVHLSESLRTESFRDIDTWRAIVSELLRGKQLMDVATRAREPMVRCPHEQCRFHRTGLCDGWLSPPQTADDCEFPEYLAVATNRTVNADGTMLIESRSNGDH